MALLEIHDGALPTALFARLWRGVRRVGRERFRQSHWVTFWYELGEPRTVVDEAVLHLRRRYPAELAPKARGVEWWLGRTDLRRVPIDLHCDRDNRLFDETGRLRHPERSSVLYFNRVRGGCLLVTAQRQRPDGTLVPAEPRDWAVAKPAPNRFVSFAGHRLHGVLDANNEIPHGPLRERAGRVRYALVINWWRRCPSGVEPWDGSIYRALGARRG